MREFTAGELRKILKEHKRWCDTDGDEGEMAYLDNVNLSRANLSRANLHYANLSEADLFESNLSNADLHEADLYKANLRGANLRGTDLSNTNLFKANLRGANLSNANLFYADLSDTNLFKANLRDANLSSAILEDADLRGAKLIRVRGLTLEQLSKVKTLCDAGLSLERMKQVRKKYPHLLEESETQRIKQVTLRSSYKTLSVSQVQSMPNVSIREKWNWGFYGHSTIKHDYNLKTIKGDKVVVDNATGLMWCQSGSKKNMVWNEARQWVKDLNSRGYAGYSDWRLPTVEEAVSLLESSETNGDLYIDPVFSRNQCWIWTGDKFEILAEEAAWHVAFGFVGSVDWRHYISRLGTNHRYVRPVRSVE